MTDKIPKGKKVLGADREKLGKDLQAQYQEGASVRALAESLGRSYGFVHRMLAETGVVMRSRSGHLRKPRRAAASTRAVPSAAQNPRIGR